MKQKSNDIPQFENRGIIPKFDSTSMMLFFDYVLNRHDIQMKKDSGLPYPWTDNKILATNSFTCNRRVDDKTTKWLINNISNNPILTFGEKFWKSIIFRLYNKIETAEILNLVIASFDELFNKYSFELDKTDFDVYTRAYNTISIRYIDRDKYPEHTWKSLVLLRIIKLAKTYNYQVPQECLHTAKESFEWIKNTIKGAGDFIAMQLLIDLTYIDNIPYSNNCFVIAGPGAVTGLDRIISDKKGLSYEECLYYIKENFEELCHKYYDSSFKYSIIKEDLNDEYCYCITDVQNLFCEYSKFRYLMEDRHKKKRKYIPNIENNQPK